MDKKQLQKRKVKINDLLKGNIVYTGEQQTVDLIEDFNDLKPGISVIIPTYQGEEYIKRCLHSLRKQSLPPIFFEVIFIINGEKDSTENIINEYINKYDLNNFFIYYNNEANVSLARNKGIDLAEREFITFLDDDDYISNNFLEKMIQYSNLDSVTISQLVDINCDGLSNPHNAINEQIREAETLEDIKLENIRYVVSMNACKTLPTHIVKKHKYIKELKSGEDVVFFSEIFMLNNLNVNIIPVKDKATYFRYLKESSISRQEMNYEFYITQRLEVIKSLNELLEKVNTRENRTYLQRKINGQASFIAQYVGENTDEKDVVLRDLDIYDFTYFPYNKLDDKETGV